MIRLPVGRACCRGRLVGLLVLGLGLLGAPLTAQPQHREKTARVGILVPGPSAPEAEPYSAFRQGLRAELVALKPDVIFAVAAPAIRAVAAGGLMSYGPSLRELYRRSATHADKILKGTEPGDLPIEQPTTFDLVINRTTAGTFGLTIPQSLVVRANQVHSSLPRQPPRPARSAPRRSRARVGRAQPLGHRMRVELTPEHLTQGHWFECEIDQSYLPPVIAQCASLLEKFPVRDPKGRGV